MIDGLTLKVWVPRVITLIFVVYFLEYFTGYGFFPYSQYVDWAPVVLIGGMIGFFFRITQEEVQEYIARRKEK